MKDKLLDLGLLMALVIVALLVGITLYGPSFNFKGFSRDSNPIIQTNPSNNLNSANDSNATTDSNPNPDTSNSNSTGDMVQVVNPNNPNAATTANTNTTVNENSSANTTANSTANSTANTTANTNTEVATQSETTNQGSSPSNSNPAEIVAAALPEGSFDLQSIGFSYVTGGSGACGITLEAWKHVAVSRDILAKYPCGSKITINIDKTIAGHSSFTAIVGDTMNSKHSKTVNIYVGRDEPALEYGRQEGSLIP